MGCCGVATRAALLLLWRLVASDDCVTCPSSGVDAWCVPNGCGAVVIYDDAAIDAWLATECWTIGGDLVIGPATVDRVTASG